MTVKLLHQEILTQVFENKSVVKYDKDISDSNTTRY